MKPNTTLNHTKEKLWAEMSMKEKITANFKEGSMLYLFYLWLFKKKKKNGNEKK